MTKEQRAICEAYVRDHWHEDISTERLLECAAQHVNMTTTTLRRPFDTSDAAEVVRDMPDETDTNSER